MRTALPWIWIATLAACGGGSAAPTATLERYASVLKAKNYDAAYDLMSSEFRAEVNKDEFVRMLRDNPREVSDTAARLAGQGAKLEVSADLVYGFGDTFRMTYEDGEWRVAENPLAFYDQSSPRAALRSFVRAYRLERWPVMLGFVPKAYAERMTAEKLQRQFTGDGQERIQQLVNTLEANLEAPIVEQGNEARLRYGAGNEVKFVREDGRWRLKDLD